MLSSGLPSLVPLPFANGGSKNVIPTASSPTPGLASLTDGFPALTSTPISAGGIPPVREDFNGILNLLSANTQWSNAGGFYPYDSGFSTSIGGYPKGALLAMASGPGFWLSRVDNNTVNPDSGPSANWIAMSPAVAQSGAYNYAADTGSANAYVVTLSPVPSALVAGLEVFFVAGNTNTTASNLNLNALGNKSITKSGTVALAPGDIKAGAMVLVVYDGTRWQLMNPSYATGSLIGVQVFTSTGTYTPTPGTNSVVVEVQGGGGGGGGSPAAAAGQSGISGGGGGGAYARSRITSGFSGVTVTVGAGGTAGSAGGNGGNGGTSSFGALVSCPGGGAGLASGTSAVPGLQGGGLGAAISTGGSIVNSQGSPGGQGIVVATSFGYGGGGGGSYFGGGANPQGGTGSSAPGVAAVSKGAGGSGGFTAASGSAQVGGAGAAGIVIVHEYS